MTSFRSLLFTLAKLLALPWRLATYQPSAAGTAAARQSGRGRRGRGVGPLPAQIGAVAIGGNTLPTLATTNTVEVEP